MKRLIFTICSNNYLAHALTLMASIHQFESESQRVIVLVDLLPDSLRPLIPSEMTLLEAAGLGIPDFDWMTANYDIVELNTAVKPAVIEHLLNTYAPERLYYIDPDICFYDTPALLDAELGEADALLTPHSLTPVPAGWYPADLHFLNHGVFNLGFLGLRNTANARALVKWWHDRLHRQCFVAYWRGMFVDQIWFNLAPVYFPNIKVCRHPGFNVAFWNLHERNICEAEGRYLVNGTYPLVFYHFSAYRPETPDRMTPAYYFNKGFQDFPGLRPIYKDYQQRLCGKHFERFSTAVCCYVTARTQRTNLRRKLQEISESENMLMAQVVRIQPRPPAGQPYPRFYYLSEMALSAQHGGGLTLQRILGEDVYKLRKIIQLTLPNFSNQTIQELESRVLCLPAAINDGLPMSKCSASYWEYQYRKWAHRLRDRAFASREEASAIKCARFLAENLALEDGLILMAPQGRSSVRIMNQLRKRRRFGYITWVMDDHVLKYDAVSGFHYPDHFEDEMRQHLQQAAKIFVISDAMGEFYRERFGVESETLFGPCDPVGEPLWNSPVRGAIRLCYFGSIWDWQRDALEALAGILHAGEIELDIYSYHELPATIRSPAVRVQPPVSAADVIYRIREYDAVIIPAGFSDEVRALTDLNISTKLSECLASGTLTVIVAPERAAMSRFVRQHRCGIVLSEFNPQSRQILHRVRDADFRQPHLKAAQQVVRTITGVNTMRAKWLAARREFLND